MWELPGVTVVQVCHAAVLKFAASMFCEVACAFHVFVVLKKESRLLAIPELDPECSINEKCTNTHITLHMAQHAMARAK